MPSSRPFAVPDKPDFLAQAREFLDHVRRERAAYQSSPPDWRNEVLYFLLPDRFSDGKENTRPLLDRDQIKELRRLPERPDWNWHLWAESGKNWQGGTINGITGRLDYLKGLGITALWIGPIYKQRTHLDTYHGYGIQDFLDVDPRFGTRDDLIELVSMAHERGIRIILDVIINHSGDNWGYLSPNAPPSQAQNEPFYRPWPDHYGNPLSDARGWRLAWRDQRQRGFTLQGEEIESQDQGVWPRDLQSELPYTRAGRGSLGAGEIEDPHAEHKRTDFFALKDFALDVPPMLSLLADCFKYWIALSDCDGFRIDTVKHISLEEARNFCGAIREFAETLGKHNFLLVGEIAGGDYAQDFVLDNLAILQRNLNAALDIGSARINLQVAGKGLAPGAVYLNSFNEASIGFESHRSFGDRHVSILDDHDHVAGDKVRFSSEIPDDSKVKDYQVAAGTALQLFTLGIPCIYYGTEQAFAGPAHSQLRFLLAEGWNDGGNHGDRYLREAMFGPENPRASADQEIGVQISRTDPALPGFGPFGTAGKHCFDAGSPAYIRIAALCRIRAEYLPLRVGRQYPRQVRIPGTGFQFPAAGELVAWSRLLDSQEAVCVINPNGAATRGGDVVVSAELWSPGTEFSVVANTAHTAAGDAFRGEHPIGSAVTVKGLSRPGEPAYLEIRGLPPAEVIVLIKHF